MDIRQIRSRGAISQEAWSDLSDLAPDLVLVFGGIAYFQQPDFLRPLRAAFPKALLMGCSTAGEITREGALENQLVLTALKLSHPRLRITSAPLTSMEDSHATGKQLGDDLRSPLDGAPLRGVLLLGQGVRINGSAILSGLQETLIERVPICGALAGDDGIFARTYTLCQETVSDQDIVALGFYGDGLELRYGSAGGWIPFGPIRRVTCARNNMLFELDGEPALDVYRRYLGEWAKDLPSSGLLFPIALLEGERHDTGLIRTLVGIDEPSGGLVVAGDVPEQGCVRLMHADISSLVNGAREAALKALENKPAAELALLFSCVGRKLMMGGRVDEEIDAVAEVLDADTILAGFYSYGEIGPHNQLTDVRLHNHTMTVMLLSERS